MAAITKNVKGGLNGTTRSWRNACVTQSQMLKRFASTDSNSTLTWLVLIDYRLTDPI